MAIKNSVYVGLAEQVLYTGRINLAQAGLWFRSGKGHEDIRSALKKVINTPPLKAENHASDLAIRIQALTTSKQPSYTRIPD